MKICILGGGNVYALNLARHLHSLGIEHFGIGRTGPKAPAFWQVEHAYEFHALHMIYDMEDVLAVLDRRHPDVIVNFLAQGERAASFGEQSRYFYGTNTLALVQFAEEMVKRDYLKRFVQISSSEIYGSATRALRESDEPRPSSPYAVSKLAFDLHLGIMHATRGFPINIIRPSNAYCPGQQLHRVIPRTIRCALTDRKLELHGGGKARKSYLHAGDLSRAIVGVIERGAIGATYNCGPTGPVSIKALIGVIAEACGRMLEEITEDAPEREGEDDCYWLDSTALAAATGWTQTVGLAQGIEEMVRWVRAYPELLEADDIYRIAA